MIELARELGALPEKARAGKLAPAEMQGATFTISCLGGIGTAFSPIVNAPEVAILGVVRSRMSPVWDGKAFQPRLMLPLCLSYHHDRVIDGAAAARFMRHLAGVVEDMRRDIYDPGRIRRTMAMANEITLPDIGDFKDVPIIESLSRPGRACRRTRRS